MPSTQPDAVRRAIVAGAILSAAGVAAGALRFRHLLQHGGSEGIPASRPTLVRMTGAMPYRTFGRTGIEVSEIGFGAWGIGGKSYGAVDQAASLSALARAEELDCNFVDTAAISGNSEAVLGEFLKGRRDKWVVATKFSRQAASMTAALEAQLQRLGTDAVDLYQLHWVPHDNPELFDELRRLKQSGKTRFIGVSLYSVNDIDFVLDSTEIDSVQLPLSLLDPFPFVARVAQLRESGVAVIIRSVLREGFLTGKFGRDATFSDPNDQRRKLRRDQIEQTVELVERFRFLERDAGSLLQAAIRYPLSFPEVSTVILGTKSVLQADANFGIAAGGRLSDDILVRVRELQQELNLGCRRQRWPCVSCLALDTAPSIPPATH